MKIVLIALAVFLVAFAGLATGLIFRGKGLRGGCGSKEAGRDCQCRSVSGKEGESAGKECTGKGDEGEAR